MTPTTSTLYFIQFLLISQDTDAIIIIIHLICSVAPFDVTCFEALQEEADERFNNKRHLSAVLTWLPEVTRYFNL